MKVKNIYAIMSILCSPMVLVAQASGGGATDNGVPVTAGSGAVAVYSAGWWWFWGIVLLAIISFIIWYLARTPAVTHDETGTRGTGIQHT